jgi:SAM-dependent methyltransferase
MGVAPGVVAIDLCCGDGLFTVPLANIAKRVYAIDIDPVMLDRARARVAETRSPCARRSRPNTAPSRSIRMVATFGEAGGESKARLFEVFGYAFLAHKPRQ